MAVGREAARLVEWLRASLCRRPLPLGFRMAMRTERSVTENRRTGRLAAVSIRRPSCQSNRQCVFCAKACRSRLDRPRDGGQFAVGLMTHVIWTQRRSLRQNAVFLSSR